MIKWEAFKYNGTEYDLSHIHPETIEYVQPAKGELPARVGRTCLRCAEWIASGGLLHESALHELKKQNHSLYGSKERKIHHQ